MTRKAPSAIKCLRDQWLALEDVLFSAVKY